MAHFNAALYLDDDGFELDYSTPRLSGAFSSPAGSRGGSPVDRSQQQKSARGLPLLQLSEWDRCIDNEADPTCIHYSIEWKLQLKKGRLSTLTEITEENLTLAPSAYWEKYLRQALETIVQDKLPGSNNEPDETKVTVSVEKRNERDLRKRFDGLNLEWTTVEDKLKAWSQLFREGKKLRIDISFIYKENSQLAAMRTRSSTTKKQLAARDKLLAETGRSLW